MDPTSVHRYRRRKPTGPLAGPVQSIWTQEAPPSREPTAPTTLAPGPSLEVVFYFGDPFERVGESAGAEPPLLIAGPRSRPVRVRATGRTDLLIVRLQPWMAGALVAGEPADLVDRHLRFPDVSRPGDPAGVHERLGELRTAGERIRAVERSLRHWLADHEPDGLAVAAVGEIRRDHGALPVADLAHRLRVSERQLRRRFRAALGLGPKRFCRLVRFQHAVAMLREGDGWAAVVAECGFYDQAHLSAELRSLAGITATGLAERSDTPLGRYFNRDSVDSLHTTAYL